jgi:TonB-dependent receptor
MSQFTDVTNTVRNSLATFSGSEKIYAGYVSNTFEVGSMQVYVGLRAEIAQVNYTGHVVTEDTLGNVVGMSSVPGSQTNTDFFPSVQLRQKIDGNTDWRLAVTRGIARPNYSQLAPSLQGTLDGSKANSANLTSGNPSLRAQHAWNYDVMIEHFFPSVGVVSAGVFYKDISDFIFNKTFIYNGPVTAFDGQAGTRPENGGNGHLLGFEAQYTQRFVSLPGAFAGLGTDLNWTHVDSRALVDPASGREAPMPRTSPNLANAAITYDFGPVSARVAWAYQGANITSYGDGSATANGDTYFYAHSQIDASISYNVSSRVQVQVQGLNLNNAVFGFFNGTPSHDFSIQREYYERTVYMGLKYGF